MFFVSISYALVTQREPSFQLNMGFTQKVHTHLADLQTANGNPQSIPLGLAYQPKDINHVYQRSSAKDYGLVQVSVHLE